MLHLDIDEVNQTLADYIRVVIKVIEVKKNEFVKFIDRLQDREL